MATYINLIEVHIRHTDLSYSIELCSSGLLRSEFLTVVPKHRQEISTNRCVITQKITVLSCFAAEAWNRLSSSCFLFCCNEKAV